jgi:hypothetical protein
LLYETVTTGLEREMAERREQEEQRRREEEEVVNICCIINLGLHVLTDRQI